MRKILSAITLSVLVALTIAGGVQAQVGIDEGLGEVILDKAKFDKAIQLLETDVEYDWQIEHVFSEDDGMLNITFDEKYYRIVPAQTATYKIVSKPAFYDSYMNLYLIEEQGPVEIKLPWGEVERELYLGDSMGGMIYDYVIETELIAGQTYCVRLNSIEGGNGTLIISGGRLSQGASSPVIAQPSSKTIATTVGIAGYNVGGEVKDMPACYYRGGDTFMPIRMLQDLGVGFEWSEATKTATMTYGSKFIKLTIGSSDAYVNEVKTSIVGASGKLVAPELAPGRTMIPLRFVSEQFGFTVHWDPSNLITISLP